jgi:hypothetical protein
MHGKPRSAQLARLVSPIYPNTNTIRVPAGLDYKVGDKLIVAPTSFNWIEDEVVIVTEVDTINNCYDNGGNIAGPCTVLTVAV